LSCPRPPAAEPGREPSARPRDLDRHLCLVSSAQFAAVDYRAPADEQQFDRLRRAEDERCDGILDARAFEPIDAP